MGSEFRGVRSRRKMYQSIRKWFLKMGDMTCPPEWRKMEHVVLGIWVQIYHEKLMKIGHSEE